MLKWGFYSMLVVALGACASLRTSELFSGAQLDPRVRAEQESELQKADQALESEDFPAAEKLYSTFQTRFPTSIFYQRAQFGRAKAIENLDRWSEAAELYRQTVDATRSRQPEIAAQALYQLSFCYENLGDEARVLASLKDALQLKGHLTPEQAEAEIPARMAASYNRMGRVKEADQYFIEADRGIQKIRALKNSADSVWLSRTYYQMGVFSTNQVGFENLQASLDTLKMVQTFSLLSAEAGGQPWSKKSAQGLMMNYQDLWKTIQQIPLNKAMDPGAAQREQADRQVNFTRQLLTLVNELKSYRTPEPGSESAEAKELFKFIGQLEKQAQDFLYVLRERNPLTPEAQKRGGLKR